MEIKIGKSGRQCCASGHAFQHGDEVVSSVKLHDRAYLREDFAKAFWRDDLAKDAVAVWSTRYRDPKVEESQPPEVFSPLRQIFYTSAESDDRHTLAKAFLAAQLLRRQKAFRLLRESVEDDGSRVVLFADRIGDRLIEVRDPALTYEELESARQHLLEELRELENPEDEAATHAEEETEAKP